MATPGQSAGGGGVGALGGRILTAVPGAMERSSLFNLRQFTYYVPGLVEDRKRSRR